MDTWVQSELQRFHRGISLTLLVLATLILSAEVFRFLQLHDGEAFLALLLPLGFAECKLLSSLFAGHHETDTSGALFFHPSLT